MLCCLSALLLIERMLTIIRRLCAFSIFGAALAARYIIVFRIFVRLSSAMRTVVEIRTDTPA
jgi:hypothetical protein